VVSLLKAISSIAEITKDLVQDLQIEHGVVAYLFFLKICRTGSMCS